MLLRCHFVQYLVVTKKVPQKKMTDWEAIWHECEVARGVTEALPSPTQCTHPRDAQKLESEPLSTASESPPVPSKAPESEAGLPFPAPQSTQDLTASVQCADGDAARPVSEF